MSEAIAIEAVRQHWHSRGFTCGIWVDPPGQVWEDYVHSTDELVMTLEGEVEFEIDGRAFIPAVGEELFIPAHVRHSVRNKGNSTARWLYGYKTVVQENSSCR